MKSTLFTMMMKLMGAAADFDSPSATAPAAADSQANFTHIIICIKLVAKKCMG